MTAEDETARFQEWCAAKVEEAFALGPPETVEADTLQRLLLKVAAK